jgi:hypothetical protein
MAYETVIGVETHVELATRSKMFCGCPNGFGAEPNSSICPVCLGLPGALPVPNERAIAATVSLGLAVESEIAPRSLFHRKNNLPDLAVRPAPVPGRAPGHRNRRRPSPGGPHPSAPGGGHRQVHPPG